MSDPLNSEFKLPSITIGSFQERSTTPYLIPFEGKSRGLDHFETDPLAANFTKKTASIITLFRGTKLFDSNGSTLYDILITEDEESLCIEVKASIRLKADESRRNRTKLIPLYIWSPSLYHKLDRDQIDAQAAFIKSKEEEYSDCSNQHHGISPRSMVPNGGVASSKGVTKRSEREYTLMAVRNVATQYIFDRLVLVTSDTHCEPSLKLVPFANDPLTEDGELDLEYMYRTVLTELPQIRNTSGYSSESSGASEKDKGESKSVVRRRRKSLISKPPVKRRMSEIRRATVNLKVLVVDDSKPVRTIVKRVLSKDNCNVIEAPDGETGLEEYDKSLLQNTPFDVVLIARILPGKSGPEITRILRQKGFRGLILGFMGSADICQAAEFIDSGADDVIVKPLNPVLLKSAVRRLHLSGPLPSDGEIKSSQLMENASAALDADDDTAALPSEATTSRTQDHSQPVSVSSSAKVKLKPLNRKGSSTADVGAGSGMTASSFSEGDQRRNLIVDSATAVKRLLKGENVLLEDGSSNKAHDPGAIAVSATKVPVQIVLKRKDSFPPRVSRHFSNSSAAIPLQPLTPIKMQRRVLVVDDSRPARSIVRNVLTKDDYCCVLEAPDGMSCLDEYDGALRDGLKIDVVLIARVLPHLMGPDAVQELRKCGYKGLVLGFMGSADPAYTAEFIASGADDVLTKPVDPVKLREAVGRTSIISNTSNSLPARRASYSSSRAQSHAQATNTTTITTTTAPTNTAAKVSRGLKHNGSHAASTSSSSQVPASPASRDRLPPIDTSTPTADKASSSVGRQSSSSSPSPQISPAPLYVPVTGQKSAGKVRGVHPAADAATATVAEYFSISDCSNPISSASSQSSDTTAASDMRSSTASVSFDENAIVERGGDSETKGGHFVGAMGKALSGIKEKCSFDGDDEH